MIRREETAGAVEIMDGQPRKRSNGRVDYILKVKVTSEAMFEQERMPALIQEHMAETNNIIAMLESQPAEIESLPASLLREAFAGQI